MKWTMVWMLAVACAPQGELLPIVASDGAVVGSYDPADGSVDLAIDGDAVELADGSVAALVAGAAVVDAPLEPGDSLTVVDAAGEPLEVLTVEDPGDASGDGRLGRCAEGNFG